MEKTVKVFMLLITASTIFAVQNEADEVEGAKEGEEMPFTVVKDCLATKEFHPVCASNGNSYANPSIFYCARKIEPDLTIVSYEVCPKKPEQEPEMMQKIESEPETTQKFESKLEIESKDSTTREKRMAKETEEDSISTDKNDEPTVYAVVPGCFASRDLRPVCASNGKSYANPSIFRCAQKLEPDLKIVKNDGSCNGIAKILDSSESSPNPESDTPEIFTQDSKQNSISDHTEKNENNPESDSKLAQDSGKTPASDSEQTGNDPEAKTKNRR